MNSPMFRIVSLLNDGKYQLLRGTGETLFRWVDTSLIEDLKKIELNKENRRIR